MSYSTVLSHLTVTCSHCCTQNTKLFHHKAFSPATPLQAYLVLSLWLVLTLDSHSSVINFYNCVILRMLHKWDHTVYDHLRLTLFICITPVRSIPAVACTTSLLLSIDEQDSVTWVHHSLLTIHLLREFLVVSISGSLQIRLLSTFVCGTYIGSQAPRWEKISAKHIYLIKDSHPKYVKSTLMYIFLCGLNFYFSGINAQKWRLLGCMVSACFVFKEISNYFPEWPCHFPFPQTMHETCSFS